MTPDDTFRALQARLGQWDARRRQATLLLWLPRALAAALLVGLVVALAARARPLLTASEIALLSAALAVVAVAATAIVALARRRSLAEQARFADRRFALRERATAAVEIQAGQHDVSPALAARQLGDTLAAATRRPCSMMPIWVQMSATSDRMWDEKKIVLPMPCRARSSSRISIRARGSRPLAGSSRMSTCGSWVSVRARQRRCFMPRLSVST